MPVPTLQGSDAIMVCAPSKEKTWKHAFLGVSDGFGVRTMFVFKG